jgi:hypothetical protein
MTRNAVVKAFNIPSHANESWDGFSEIRFDSLSLYGFRGAGFFQFRDGKLTSFSWNQDPRAMNSAELQESLQAFHVLDSALTIDLGKPFEKAAFDPKHHQNNWKADGGSTVLVLDHFELHLNVLSMPRQFAIPVKQD